MDAMNRLRMDGCHLSLQNLSDEKCEDSVCFAASASFFDQRVISMEFI
tara:strand:- start:199 stop:342 length:144 start_codon:yes stop_codon:yes gene_type:complete